METLVRQAARVDNLQLSAATPARDLLFGWSGAYWLDLRGYDPVATAAALGKPMLILQGGRDYQVTVAQDLARWRAVLGGRPRITIRTYEADNHLFFSGTGPWGPQEYEAAQHVDPAVIGGLTEWLLAT